MTRLPAGKEFTPAFLRAQLAVKDAALATALEDARRLREKYFIEAAAIARGPFTEDENNVNAYIDGRVKAARDILAALTEQEENPSNG